MAEHTQRTGGQTERVVFDSSALLSNRLPELIAGAVLNYYLAYWSSWIVAEVVRKRTEWIAERAIREGCSRAELRQRLRGSRERVNRLVSQLSSVPRPVDFRRAPPVDLDWLRDHDDWPVMQTALAADAAVLVTANSMDFPIGEIRHGILLLDSSGFLAATYARDADRATAIRDYIRGIRGE